MATFPQLANPYSSSLRRSVRGEWIPVLFALVFVAFTSTSFMGGSHTQVFVIAVWRAVFGGWHLHWAVEANQIGRKIGHFLGYGVIGLLFRKAWFVTMRAYAMIGNRLILFSSTLGVASTFLLASGRPNSGSRSTTGYWLRQLGDCRRTFLPRILGPWLLPRPLVARGCGWLRLRRGSLRWLLVKSIDKRHVRAGHHNQRPNAGRGRSRTDGLVYCL